jgi:hypothetical protein
MYKPMKLSSKETVKQKMKKIILALFIMLTVSVFAQRKNTISGFLNSGFGDQIGISYELQKETKFLGLNTSQVINLTKGYIDLYYINYPELREFGSGFIGEFGYKVFFNKDRFSRWYIQNSVSTGYIKFKGSNYFKNEKYDYDSTFSYFSIFQPEIGYRINIWKFSIDPAIGWQWNIELKSQGGLDNKTIDNTFVKVGLKVGYSF